MSPDRASPTAKRIAVIGGGAAGFFTAITAAEADPEATVQIFEKSRQLLTKVAISGGGRCNVTHACFEPRELVRFYPRGGKELRGAFHAWQPLDMIEWFRARGVELKREDDGRMFPVTDSSATIIDCLIGAARSSGVTVRLATGVTKVVRAAEGVFELELSTGEREQCDRLALTTGGGQGPSGHGLAASLGHSIAPIAPSLFTFNIQHPLVTDLAGVSIEAARVSYQPLSLTQSGPVLFTHWGLSGPGILKLSAWGARAFKEVDYAFEIEVNWCGDARPEQVRGRLDAARAEFARRQLSSANPFGFPKRFWERLLALREIPLETQWAQLTKAAAAELTESIVRTRLPVTGKSTNKDEFVTCGGVALDEIDFRTMQSKRVPQLYFAGEVLDIDGVTGGFNFQAAWTTARLAGLAMANSN